MKSYNEEMGPFSVQTEFVTHVYCKKCKQHTLLTFLRVSDERFCHIHLHPSLCVRRNGSPMVDELELDIKLETKDNVRIAYCPLCNEPLERWIDYPPEFEFTTSDDVSQMMYLPAGELPKERLRLVRFHLYVDGKQFVTRLYSRDELEERDKEEMMEDLSFDFLIEGKDAV